MNERLEKLAEQAGFKNVVGVLDGKVELQKFAELIVRECADVVKYYYIRGGEPITPQHIKKHFGVEE
jgi:hypothetical protein